MLQQHRRRLTLFYEILHTQINNHFPKKRTECTTSDKPWMTTKIKSLILKRQKAFNLGHHTWRFYRNTVSRAIRTAKHSYTASKLSEANTSRDPIAWYWTVKRLCGIHPKNRNFHITGMEDVSSLDTADAINAHFNSIVSSLPALDRRNCLPSYLHAIQPP